MYFLIYFLLLTTPVQASEIEFLSRADMAVMLYDNVTIKDDIYCTVNAFIDTDATAFYNEAVSSLSNAGVFEGYRCGKFAPDRNTTYAEFVASVMRLYDIELSEGTEIYHSDKWYAQYMLTATDLGFITTADEYFINPDIAIVKEDAVNILNKVKEEYSIG